MGGLQERGKERGREGEREGGREGVKEGGGRERDIDVECCRYCELH